MRALITFGAIAVFGVSCGGTEFPVVQGASPSTTTTTLTKAEYVARANEVCRTMDTRVAAVGDPGADPSQDLQAYDADIDIAADTLRQLRDLPVPDGDATALALIYNTMDQSLKDAAALSSALRAGDQVAASRASQDENADSVAVTSELNAYGLTDCGGSDLSSPPTAPSPPPTSPQTTVPRAPAPPAPGTQCGEPFPCGGGTSSIPAPTSVAAGVVKRGDTMEVMLSWQPAPGYPDWRVHRGDDGTPFEQSPVCNCAGSPGHGFDTDVPAGRYTYYVVTAAQDRTTFSHPVAIVVDVPDARSVPASWASGTPCDDSYPCGGGTSSIPTPTSVAASVAMHQDRLEVTITWQPSADYPAWKVYRGDDRTPFVQAHLCYCAGGPGRAFDDENVVAGHRYTYYVVALSQDDNTFSQPALITVDVPLRP